MTKQELEHHLKMTLEALRTTKSKHTQRLMLLTIEYIKEQLKRNT